MQNRPIDNEDERVFEENFVKRQEEIISQASALITKHGLLEAEKIKTITDYIRDLHANIKNYSICGKSIKERDFLGLMKLIEDTQNDLRASWHLKDTHPLIPALQTIKNNLIKSLEINQPQYWLQLQNQFLDNDEKKHQIKTSKCTSVYEILKDSCGILACLLWYLPEKTLTVANGFEPCCGPTESCCPETKLPQQGVYWNLWAPKESINALCQDITAQSDNIQGLNQRLKQIPMSRL